MNSTHHVQISFGKALALIALALLWQFITWRTLGGILFFFVLIAYWWMQETDRSRPFFCMVALFVLVPLTPFDISFQIIPGVPRFVPLVMGYPSKATFQKAKRGEVAVGGCMVNGFEPKWVWVW